MAAPEGLVHEGTPQEYRSANDQDLHDGTLFHRTNRPRIPVLWQRNPTPASTLPAAGDVDASSGDEANGSPQWGGLRPVPRGTAGSSITGTGVAVSLAAPRWPALTSGTRYHFPQNLAGARLAVPYGDVVHTQAIGRGPTMAVNSS
ncbi:hypothetical protein GCM10009864_82650 [Streptomyces lunalinharesii]|uniref:Uncharacterized protein n=1 Tax=Streptomyces lunalinharesii TaxID=333384 RepID=A0ABN3T8M4_9ACTN